MGLDVLNNIKIQMTKIQDKRIHGLYAICDNSLCPDRSLPWLAEQLLFGGTKILQLRVKGGDPATVAKRREAAVKIIQLKNRFDFCFIINDDLQIARELSADGVHVGIDDPPIDRCRRLLGPRKQIGYSAHSLDEARKAEEMGADYVAFGAIFPSPTKGPDHPIQGLNKLRELTETVSIPVVAIGGITHENVRDVMESGALAAAMISALTTAPNVITATHMMIEKIRKGV